MLYAKVVSAFVKAEKPYATALVLIHSQTANIVVLAGRLVAWGQAARVGLVAVLQVNFFVEVSV